MSRRDERVGAMFEHLGCEALCENLLRRVEVVEHCVAPPPPHQVDGVWVNLRHEESHGPSFTEGACADVHLGETDRQACCSDDGYDDGGNVSPLDLLPPGAFILTLKRRLDGGGVEL